MASELLGRSLKWIKSYMFTIHFKMHSPILHKSIVFKHLSKSDFIATIVS